MKLTKKLKDQLERSKRIDELSRMDIDKLVILKRLTEKQRHLLKMWKETNEISTLANKMGCSRPLVYKIIKALSELDIRDIREDPK